MRRYQVIRTDTADAGIRKIILLIAENFGIDTALEKLEKLEQHFLLLAENPYLGMDPKDMILRRQRFKVLILEKNLAFYKIDESKRVVTVYAVVDQRQDYLRILRGL